MQRPYKIHDKIYTSQKQANYTYYETNLNKYMEVKY